MTTKERRDLYEEVSATILERLDAGEIPWERPWRVGVDAHRNPITGTIYRGINPLLLEISAMTRGFSDPRWVTFKQAKGAGGRVRAGERGTTIVFFKRLMVDDKENPGEKRAIFMLRHYTVFNVAQVDGLELEDEGSDYVPEEMPEADAIVSGYFEREGAPELSHGGDVAGYAPSIDAVRMPPRQAFHSESAYYGTLFHEAVHSTGHADRLNRTEITKTEAFGSDSYGREELTAEFGAAMLGSVAGLDVPERSVGYLQHWRDAIAADTKLVVFAAQRAQKAADYILGVKGGE